jgi:putative hydrolase of the HAD superfamily
MSIKAVVFDIGGVLEITPDLGIYKKLEMSLRMQPGELTQLLKDANWGHDGSLGFCTEEDERQRLQTLTGMDQAQLEAFWADLWEEYLGTLNVRLAEYFASLCPRYQTAILSNSFVGAREREEAHYHFSEMCDFIIYSHEVGLAKPDPRIFALTCERLGLEPAEAIFLDDVPRIIAAAQDFGMHAVLFRETEQAIAEIEACMQDIVI